MAKRASKTILLTGKQLEVLRCFRDYFRAHGLAPTLEEVADSLGVSKITIYEHVGHLESKGAVRRIKGLSRAVEVLYDPDEGREAERREGGGVPSAAPPSLPLLGSIAAGKPIEALEDRETVPVTDLIPSDDRHYLLRVKGKSMIEDHIDHGDLVVVERRETARNGEIVVAIVNGEQATLKRFFREGDRIRLQPANSEMEPTYPEQVEIRGVVKGVIRRFR
jgi:repressor LexA